MNKLKKIKKWFVIPLIFFICVIILAIYNIKLDSSSFFTINAANVITICIAILFSFLFTQYLTEDRKKQEIIDNIIVEIKNTVDDSYLYIIDQNTDQDVLRAKIRRIQNNIDLLKRIHQKRIATNDIEYVSNQFDTYNDMIDGKLNDFDYLSKSQKSLKRILDLINSKLNQMRIDLYELGK